MIFALGLLLQFTLPDETPVWCRALVCVMQLWSIFVDDTLLWRSK